jgi:hypothetical protein
MAKLMQFSSPDKVTHDSSYWKVVQCNLNLLNKTGEIVFLGYHDKAARMELAQPVGMKQYTLNPELFDTYFSSEVQKENDKTIYTQCYLLADTEKVGPAPAEGEEDTRKPFFDGATDA